MASHALAGLLIVTGVLLLAVVNQLGWLLVMVPLSLLVARSVMSTARPRNTIAREFRKD
jgi:hypothetical protein